MGLKGAASYFQRMMASVVLAGLLYSIVELFAHRAYRVNVEDFHAWGCMKLW